MEENKLLFTTEIIKEKVAYAYSLDNENEMKKERDEICHSTRNRHLFCFFKLLSNVT